MYKKFLYGETALQSILEGAEIIYKTVATTFGPFGKYVISEQKNAMPKITKDGVSVAREIKLRNAFHELGSTSLRDIAVKTVDRAGDGTTSSIILGYNILKRGIEEKLTPFDIQDMKKCVPLLKKYIEDISISAKDTEILKGVAYMASNGDEEIANLIKEGVESIGENGHILVEEAKTLTTFLEKSDGMLINFGYSNPMFCNKSARRIVEFENPFVLISDSEIMDFQSLIPLYEELLRLHPTRAIVVIAKKVSFYAEAGMLANRGAFQTAAINADAENENWLKDFYIDLSTVCGGGFVSRSVGKELGAMAGANAAEFSDLGTAKKIVIHPDRTIIIPSDDNLESIKSARESLLEVVQNCADENMKRYFNERLARMSEGVAILKIGGITEQSTKERADRIEDAVCAVHSARKKGVLPGACVSFDYAAEFLKKSELKDKKGCKILVKALNDLSSELFKYTGYSRHVEPYYDKKMNTPKEWSGFNFRSMQVENLWESKVLDATSVILETMQNSVDVASSLLMVDAAVAIERDSEAHNHLRLSTIDNDMMPVFGWDGVPLNTLGGLGNKH